MCLTTSTRNNDTPYSLTNLSVFGHMWVGFVLHKMTFRVCIKYYIYRGKMFYPT